VRAAPERDDFRFALAAALRTRGRAGEAAKLLRAAPASSQLRPELQIQLASALVDAGDLDGAQAALRAASDAAPGDARIQALRAALEERNAGAPAP
jgi:thioredoxin-like negative regulator of GroEL